MERLICLAIGYVCGLFQTSYIIGRLHKTDIREHGSGNAGTTNALRTFGKKAGILTLLGLSEVCGSDCSCACFPWKDLWRYSSASESVCGGGLYSGT